MKITPSRPFPVVALCMIVAAVPTGAAPTSPPVPYRHLVVYTTSKPDAGGAARIMAATRFLNRGATDLQISATLTACKALGFTGTNFSTHIPPGREAAWTWAFDPTNKVVREILTGSVDINGRPDRNLFIAIQGPDPTNEPPIPKCETITNRAEVVATYAPRSEAAIAATGKTPSQERPVVLAGKAGSPFVIAAEAMPPPGDSTNVVASWRTSGKLTPPQAELLDAIEDLQRCVRIQAGAVLPVVHKSPDTAAIVLRLADPGKAGGLQDAYRLRIRNKLITVESLALDGIRHGIYGLLTDHMGCRWFQPRALGEEIPVPDDGTIRLAVTDEVRGSPWISVGGMSWGSDPLWERRNRAFINRARMNFGHSWVGYVNPGEFPYDKFPQYYARDRDGRIRMVEKKDEDWTSTNFCPTDTNVIEIVARKINAFFDANPDAVVASLDPNDYAPMCLCERCLEMDRKYGAKTTDGTDVADRLMHFSIEIHKRLKQEHRGKYLGILIYGYQMEMPQGAKPHEHHAGMICNFPPRYDHSRPWNDPTSPWNADFNRLVKGWGSILKQLGYYDYYGHYYYFGPFGVIHKMREDLPAFRELGGTFLMLENEPVFAAQGMNHYVSARLAWDIDTDVDAAVEDFITGYYGPATGPMRRFWLAAERHFALERPGTRTETRVGARPGFWNELDGYIKEAQAIAAALPPAQKRFADRVAFNADGYEYGHLVFEYDLAYGRLADRLHTKKDLSAAVGFLESHRSRLDAIRKKYSENGAYWPPFMPSWSWLDVDAVLGELRKQ